jgi:hypothetical protein
MNVLVLMPQLPSVSDRCTGLRTRQMLGALHKAGMRAHVVSFGGAGDASASSLAGLVASCTVFDRPLLGPIRGAYSLCVSGTSYAVVRDRSVAVQRHVDQLVAREDFQAAICCGPAMTQYVPRKKVAFYMLDLATPRSAVLDARAKAAGPLMRGLLDGEACQLQKIEYRQAELAELIVVSTDIEAQTLARRCQRRQVLAVPDGVVLGPRPGRASITAAAPRVAMCADFTHEPYAPAVRDFITTTWPQVLRAQRTAELLIIAKRPPGWLRSATQAGKRIEISERFDDPSQDLRRAIVYVSPWSEPRGVSMVLPQVMGSGLAAVVHPAMAARLIEPLRRQLTVAQTPQQWSDALDRLLGDRGAAYDMASRAYEAAAQHGTAETVWNPVVDLLRAAASGDVDLPAQSQPQRRGFSSTPAPIRKPTRTA